MPWASRAICPSLAIGMDYHNGSPMKYILIRRSKTESPVTPILASIFLLIISLQFLPGAEKLAGSSPIALAASDPVIAAAGDIACDPAASSFNAGNGTATLCRQKYTSDLLVNAGLAAVLPLGDVQYYCGGYQAFLQSYDLSWGRVKAISRPVVGNHEYLTTPDPSGPSTGCDITNDGAAGYFDYFGAAAGNPGQGYYSYDIGAWHLIALNSNCTDAGGCGPLSPQGKWLQADLAAHPNFCTLAYWHTPFFSSGGRAEINSKDLWQILYDNNVDLILNGHDHIYERFAPQDPNGIADPIRGIRQFTVGTGGSNHTSLAAIAANSEVRDTTTYGVLKLTLHATSYDWRFVPEVGQSFSDSGTGFCHGNDVIPPGAPSNLTAVAVNWNQVALSWTAGTDNVGVAGYQIFRNGVQIASSSRPSYVDTTTQAQTTYRYSVKTVDTAGLTSPSSNTVTVTTPDAASILTFTSAADTYVQSDTPTTSYGSAAQLMIGNNPTRNAYLKFNVSGVGPRTVVSARLRLYSIDAASVGGTFNAVADTTWDENSVTWSTAPAANAGRLASLGNVSAEKWYEVNVASLVAGDGIYSLKLSSTSSDAASYLSKEGATPGFAPQLIVIAREPTPTPTATATRTPTATPTPTRTPAPLKELDTTGVFRPGNGLLYLKNTNTTGFADVAINYGLPGDYPVVGDWDGNGTATIGIYRNGTFYLRNSNTVGFADIVFAFGLPGDQPVAGDWNGDGKDTIGVYRNGRFYLRNSNSSGPPQESFSLGNAGDVGIAGDWDGNGKDTTGVFRPGNGLLYLKNTNSTGFADIAINYGAPGDQPVTGDWNNDGIDTIGVYRNGTFYLRNSNTIGFAELVFALGNPGDMPIAGNWDGLPR